MTTLTTSWSPGKPLVLQYELEFTDGPLECGGSYLKVTLAHQAALAGAAGPIEMTINVDFPMTVSVERLVATRSLNSGVDYKPIYLHCLIDRSQIRWLDWCCVLRLTLCAAAAQRGSETS